MTQCTSYEVKDSFAGKGLFATRAFVQDEFIIEYTGEKISEEEADERGGLYLFRLNKKWTVDGTDKKYTARYINHSCNPNAEAIIEDDVRIVIHATKDILPGEEITYDYGEEYVESILGDIGGCNVQAVADNKSLEAVSYKDFFHFFQEAFDEFVRLCL